VRGPDSEQGQLPEGASQPVSSDVYLVPVHQLVDHAPFRRSTTPCGACSTGLFVETLPETPRSLSVEDAFVCPECGSEAVGAQDSRYRTSILHGDGTDMAGNCETDQAGIYEYMDWLTGASPGATNTIPAEMPTEPTQISGGFEVGWLSPAEPLVTAPRREDNDLPVLVYIAHDALPAPAAIVPSDMRQLKAALASLPA